MKKNTTKLYGVVALAALLPSVAFGQADILDSGDVLIVGDVTTIDGDITVDGITTFQGQVGSSTASASSPVADPITPELQNEVLLDGKLDIFAPLSIEGQEDSSASGDSGVVIDDDGNVELNTTQITTEGYVFDVARKTQIWDETDGAGAPPGSNGLPVTDGDGVTGTLIETLVAGYWTDVGGVPVFNYIDDVANIYMADDLGTPLVDESTLLTGAFKTALEGVTDTPVNPNSGLPYDLYTSATGAPSGGMLTVNGDTMLVGNLELGAVSDVEMALTDNSSAIADNTSNIAVNSSTLDVHFGLVSTNISDIAVNSAGIAANSSTLDVHFGLVSDNISDIAVNEAGIAANSSTLVVHEGLVLGNVSDIAVNAAGIAANSSTLVVHEGLVLGNVSDIAVNAAGIAANSSTLDVHFGLVSGNISDIADIQTNGIVGIIEKKSDGIHIGEDSLVTNLNEDSGAQDIWALNDGSLTDINFLSDVNVVSKLTVQAEAADSETVITPATEIKPPYLNEDGIVADTVAVYTETGSVAVTTTNFDNSGVVATANGDLSLFASGGTQDVTSYVTAVRADIWDETQGDNAGFLAGPEVEVGGYIDMDGNFIELGVLDDDGVLDLDGLSSEELAMITVAGDPLPGGGGNLVVEGNARIDGALTLGTIADVEQSILDEVAARAAADDVLAAAINAEEVARATADDALQGGINEVASNLADEAAARAAADADIVAGYMAADAAIVSGYMAADSSIVAGYMAADQMLAARISSVEDKVESNTRGIAMVAAMTSPTVREGMENALDFSLAHFDGETGAAISYARRVNENVQLNIAAASDTDFEETVVRGGVSLQW